MNMKELKKCVTPAGLLLPEGGEVLGIWLLLSLAGSVFDGRNLMDMIILFLFYNLILNFKNNEKNF